MATEEAAIDRLTRASSAEDELIHALETLGQGSMRIPPGSIKGAPVSSVPAAQVPAAAVPQPPSPPVVSAPRSSGFPEPLPLQNKTTPVEPRIEPATSSFPQAPPAPAPVAPAPVASGAAASPSPSSESEAEVEGEDIFGRLELAVRENPMLWTAGAVAMGFAIALILRPPGGDRGGNRRKSSFGESGPLDELADSVQDLLRPAAEKFIREELTKVFGLGDIPFPKDPQDGAPPPPS